MSKLVSVLQEDNSTRSSLELLYHISRELSSALDLRTVLERILFLSMQNVGAINGSIIVLDDNGIPVNSAIITGEMIHDRTTERLKETLGKRIIRVGSARAARSSGGKHQAKMVAGCPASMKKTRSNYPSQR